MNQSWLKYMFTILAAVPGAISGAEAIITGAKQGAAKKDLAMASLGLAKGVAEGVAPEFTPMIEASSALASVAIDSAVAFANLVNKGKSHPAVATPVPLSPPVIIVDAPVAPAPPPPAPAPTSVPDATGHSTLEPHVVTGPGLHNVSPA